MLKCPNPSYHSRTQLKKPAGAAHRNARRSERRTLRPEGGLRALTCPPRRMLSTLARHPCVKSSHSSSLSHGIPEPHRPLASRRVVRRIRLRQRRPGTGGPDPWRNSFSCSFLTLDRNILIALRSECYGTVTVAYNKDPSPVKVNLGVGAYRTEEGKPLVLNVVRRAEQLLVNDPYVHLNSSSRVKEYLPITGLADFNKLSAKLIFGADRCVVLSSF
ncbi:hypothetical protein BHM03_00009517 [Ensete ventricosum]|nr:hypothetical protein BHM03_00009517 [Ensete ventricosum]